MRAQGWTQHLGNYMGVLVGWHGREMGGAEHSQEGGAKIRRSL